MLTRFEIFCRVVDAGSFTRAAEQLGYSQSAVSQTVRALEEELSTALLSRGKGGVSLTADGTAYLPYFRAICAADEALARKQQEMLGLEKSVIRIGTFTSVSRNLLPPLMHRFKALYPGVQFELLQGEYTGISRWLREGGIDLGFLGVPAAEGLCCRPLYRDKMAAVLPPEHPLYDLPNVFLTPHVAGAEGPETQRMTALVIEDIRRFLSGEPLRLEVRAQDLPHLA